MCCRMKTFGFELFSLVQCGLVAMMAAMVGLPLAAAERVGYQVQFLSTVC